MGKEGTRRRQLIVNGPIQTRIMFSAALLPFAIFALHTVLVASFSHSLSQEAVAAGVELPSATHLLVASATFLLASAGFMAIYVLLLSHRIAGPMYAIAKTLEEVKKGDANRRCHLRKHDLLWPLSDDVNAFLDWMQTRGPATAADAGQADADQAGGTRGSEVERSDDQAVDATPSLLDPQTQTQAKTKTQA